MLETLFGVGIFWWYMLGLLLFVMGLVYVFIAGKRCWNELGDIIEEGKRGTGKCITSIKHLGIYWIFLLAYMFFLVLVSVYIIVFGFQNGWSEVSTFDLATAFAYLVLLVIVALK